MNAKPENSVSATGTKKQQVETMVAPVRITCVSASYGIPLAERSISYTVEASAATKDNVKK